MEPRRQIAYAEVICANFPDTPEFREDFAVALKGLVNRRREEYEAKVPEVGDLQDLIRETTRERKRRKREEEERKADLEQERLRKADPGAYCTLQDVLNEWAASKKKQADGGSQQS